MTPVFRATLKTMLDKHPDLTIRQIAVLGQIEQAPGVSNINISDPLGLEKSVVTRCISALSERGLVTRQRSTDDARKTVCNLTEAGRALASTLGRPS